MDQMVSTRSFIHLLRVRQWTKNLLVFAVPLASGDIRKPEVLIQSISVFFVFCTVSSFVYISNDLRDIPRDRKHPKKKSRPLASGDITPKVAKFIALILFLILIFELWIISSGELVAIVSLYLFLQFLYIIKFKDYAIFELVLVSSGFVIRTLAGGFILNIYVSPYLIAVTASASMFLVTGKRFSELKSVSNSFETRSVLQDYNLDFLRIVWSVFLGSTIVFYSMWAIELQFSTHGYLAMLSTIAIVVIMLMFAQKIETGCGESPEELITSSKSMMTLAGFWLLLMLVQGVGVFR
jgi:decaprenyl-phosphate phosphoribosyltransferase